MYKEHLLSKGSSRDFISKMPSRGRFLSLFKIGFLFVLFWLCLYLYLTTYKMDLIKQFQKEDLDIKKLQEKLTNLVQRGFNNDNHQEPELLLNNDSQFIPVEVKKPTKEKVLEMDDGLTDEAKRFIKVKMIS